MKIKGILDLWDCRGFPRSRGAAKGLFYRRGAEGAEDGPGRPSLWLDRLAELWRASGAGAYREKVGGEKGQAGRDRERERERERKGYIS